MIRLTIIFLSLLLSFSCLYSIAQENSDDVTKKLQLADNQVRLGDYDGALQIIEDILAQKPRNIEAQEKKINILIKQDRSKQAITDVEKYVSTYPDAPEFYYLRAIINLQKQKYPKAIDDFDNAILYNMPGDFVYKVYLNRGMAHFYNQDFDLALADFDESLALNPGNAAAFHGKGMTKYELNQYEDAVADFRQSLKIDNSNPITHFNLAMTYFRMDDPENACYHFNKSCELGHRNACRLLMMECDINIPK